MAALSVQARTQIWRGLMRYWSRNREPVAVTKRVLYDPTTNTGAVADTDNWQDAHAGNVAADLVGYNGALAVEARTGLTLSQKGLLFAVNALARTGNVDLLRSVLGEVD